MIRINFIKEPTPNRVSSLSISPKTIKIGGLISFLPLFVIFFIFVIAPNLKKGKTTEETKYVVRDDYNPSSLLNQKVVENIVREQGVVAEKISSDGVLRLSYDELDFISRLNYEYHFAKELTGLLTRTFVSGVDLKNLAFSSFTKFSGTGIANSRDAIITVFNSLRQEGIYLAPKPRSSIFTSKSGYSFRIEGSVDFGLDLKSPFFVFENEIAPFDEIDIIIKRIIDTMKESGLKITVGPKRVSAVVAKKYRRVIYSTNIVGTYNSFANFIDNSYREQIPFAVKQAELHAVGPGVLSIDLQLLITTKR